MPTHRRADRNPKLLAWLVSASILAACNPPDSRDSSEKASAQPTSTLSYTPQTICSPPGYKTWVAHVLSIDLNRDGLIDFVACDAKDNTVFWIRKLPSGGFEEAILATEMKAPVHLEGADLDNDGDTDLMVACMSYIFPNNDQIGAVIALENLSGLRFRNRVLLDSVARVPDLLFSNGDGFGPTSIPGPRPWHGVRWLENLGEDGFQYHRIGDLPGAYSPKAADLDGDGGDQIAVMSALEQGFRNRPESPALIMEMAERMRIEGRFSRAVELLRKALSLRPNEAQAYLNLSRLYLQTDQVEKGVTAMRGALAAEEGHAMALTTLALHSINTDNQAEADRLMRRIRNQPKINPEEVRQLEAHYKSRFGNSPKRL